MLPGRIRQANRKTEGAVALSCLRESEAWTMLALSELRLLVLMPRTSRGEERSG